MNFSETVSFILLFHLLFHLFPMLYLSLFNSEKSSLSAEHVAKPYLDWAFSNLKRLGGGSDPLPPNFAISSQMTMKLAKDILLVQIFTTWQQF